LKAPTFLFFNRASYGNWVQRSTSYRFTAVTSARREVLVKWRFYLRKNIGFWLHLTCDPPDIFLSTDRLGSRIDFPDSDFPHFDNNNCRNNGGPAEKSAHRYTAALICPSVILISWHSPDTGAVLVLAQYMLASTILLIILPPAVVPYSTHPLAIQHNQPTNSGAPNPPESEYI